METYSRRHLGFRSRHRGPAAAIGPVSDEARALAASLVSRSLDPIKRASRAGGVQPFDLRCLLADDLPALVDYLMEVQFSELPSTPASFTPELALTGLPMTLHCTRHVQPAVPILMAVAHGPDFGRPSRGDALRILGAMIKYEAMLWQVAGNNGGPVGVIPWACRVALLEAFWKPESHERQVSTTVCPRCGEAFDRRYRATSPPLCRACAKESPAQRRWPDHAIAPASRGRWYLRCQAPNGCSAIIDGRRPARFCDRHALRKVSPRRRAAIRSGAA